MYVLKKAASDFMKESNSTAYPIADYELTLNQGYRGDHAGRLETSLMLELQNDLVDLVQVESHSKTYAETGIIGEDPLQASVELGQKIAKIIVERSGEIAIRLLNENGTALRFRLIEALERNSRLLYFISRNVSNTSRLSNSYVSFLSLLHEGKYSEAIALSVIILNDMETRS